MTKDEVQHQKFLFKMIQSSTSRWYIFSFRIIFRFKSINYYRRRARSTTPIKGPIHLNPDREQLLISLAESESDIAQITKHISSVKDILAKLKLVRTQNSSLILTRKEMSSSACWIPPVQSVLNFSLFILIWKQLKSKKETF